MTGKFIRRFVTIFAMVTGIIMLNACASEQDMQSNANKSSQADRQSAVRWLFVMSADEGKIYEEEGQTYLEMSGVASNVVAFSDRPVRRYKSFDTNEFIVSWQKGVGGGSFQSDSPNAAAIHAEMTAISDKHDIVPAIVELTDPKLDGDTLTFEIVQLNTQDVEFVMDREYKDVTLFIDSWDDFLNGMAAPAMTPPMI